VEPLVFERNGYLYIVGNVAPIKPSDAEIEELAFAEELRSASPNENLLWLRGQYVEGDRTNRNGQTWTSQELAIKSFTPRLMPVTVMHDPRTAVGLIADTKLLTPDANQVPRSRIDTILAVWSHRFPDVAEEIAANYGQGTLMQSMECTIGHYECLECGQGFVKLPQQAERANWCDHLKAAAENRQPLRRLLRDVNFTGTGLIFGTRRGATGALDSAHLELAAEEIAEFHERANRPDTRQTRRPSVDKIEITQSEYQDLVAKAAKVDDLAKQVSDLQEAAETAKKVPDLEKKVEDLEVAKTTAERERDTEKTAKEALEESARQATFGTERMTKLGSEFMARLPESVRTKLTEQAKSLSDEDWTARLDELAELTNVKPDAGTPGGPVPGAAGQEETSRTQFGAGPDGNGSSAPHGAARTTVLSGLIRPMRPQTPDAGKSK
jgi:hypothetical protein